MLSAPAHMPAISVANFGAGLADPDLIRGSAMNDLLGQQHRQAGLFGQGHHRHQPGARHEMLIIEQRRIDGRKLCDTCTGSAFPKLCR